MSGLPDIGTLVRKSATADLRAPVSKDGRPRSGLMVRDASLRDAPHHEGAALPASAVAPEEAERAEQSSALGRCSDQAWLPELQATCCRAIWVEKSNRATRGGQKCWFHS